MTTQTIITYVVIGILVSSGVVFFNEEDIRREPKLILVAILAGIAWPFVLLFLIVSNYFLLIIKAARYYKEEGKRKAKAYIEVKVNAYKLKYLIKKTKGKTKKEIYKLELPDWF